MHLVTCNFFHFLRKSYENLKQWRKSRYVFGDFMTASLPTLIVRYLCGLQMVAWYKKKEGRKYVVSSLGVLTWVNQMLMHSTCTIFAAFYSKELNDIFAISPIVHAGHQVQLLCYQILMFTIHFKNYKTYKLKIALYDKVMRVDRLFKAGGVTFHNRGLFWFQFTAITIVVCFMITELTFDVRLIKRMTDANQAVVLCTTSLYPALASSVTALEFVVFTWALRERFSKVNKKLKIMRGEMKLGVPGKESSSNTWRRYLLMLQDCEVTLALHNELCDIVDRVNYIFSIQLFIKLWYSFINGLFASFMSLKMLSESLKGVGNENVHRLAIQQSTWTLMISIISFLVVAFAEMAKGEGQATHLIVQRMLHYCKYEPLRRQLKMFSLKHLHYKVAFKAMGTLDYSLVYEAVGAVSTYLIMLIQFDLSSDQ